MKNLKTRVKNRKKKLCVKDKRKKVFFRSYQDGSPILLTPESSDSSQKDLGADIIIPLDELPPYHVDAKSITSSF